MKDYWFTTDEETTARISEQRDNIYDYVIDRFKHLISHNDLNDALALADEFFEWFNPEFEMNEDVISYYCDDELQDMYNEARQ